MVRTSVRAATRPPLLGAAPAILHKIPVHVLTLLDIVADLSTGGVATLVASASVEVCLLDGERDTTREIGSMGLLSSGQPQKSTAGRLGPRGRKILALIPALVLVTGVFVFFGREARAQQLELQHSDVLRYSRRANDRSNSLRNLPNREAARRDVSGRDPSSRQVRATGP